MRIGERRGAQVEPISREQHHRSDATQRDGMRHDTTRHDATRRDVQKLL